MFKQKKRTIVVIRFLCLSLLALIVLFPVLYTILYSFSSPEEVKNQYLLLKSSYVQRSFSLFPKQFSLQSYYEVFLATPNYLIKFWISLCLCSAIVVGQLLISCLGGFAFAKYTFFGKRVYFFLLLILMLMPIQVTLLPNYIVLDKLHLLGSWWALYIPSIFSPFGAFFMTLIFQGIPNEIVESAELDGASTLQILFGILVPTAKTGMISLAILTFIDSWNMVEQPMVFLEAIYQYPLSVFLASVLEQNAALQFVCGILGLIPVTLLFGFFRDELIEGISISGMK